MAMCIIIKMLPENKPPQKIVIPVQQTEKPQETEDVRFQIGTEEEEEKRPLV